MSIQTTLETVIQNQLNMEARMEALQNAVAQLIDAGRKSTATLDALKNALVGTKSQLAASVTQDQANQLAQGIATVAQELNNAVANVADVLPQG